GQQDGGGVPPLHDRLGGRSARRRAPARRRGHSFGHNRAPGGGSEHRSGFEVSDFVDRSQGVSGGRGGLIVRRSVLLVVLLSLAACARPPAPLQGAFSPLATGAALQPGTVGEHVRWGGQIVSTTPQNESTCFEVVSKPLDQRARPRWTDQTDGRFVACAPGFYDPSVYEPGREITVAGRVEAPTNGKVGAADYTFPSMLADTVYLWPKRVPRQLAYYPYWGPYPYWYGGWGGPWWGGGGLGGGGVFIGLRVGGRWR